MRYVVVRQRRGRKQYWDGGGWGAREQARGYSWDEARRLLRLFNEMDTDWNFGVEEV